MDDFYSEDYGSYADAPESATDANFFDSAVSRVNSFLAPIQDFSNSPVGSQLFSAIYEYGRGKVDAAREKAVGAFLMTSEGRKIQAEAERQTLAGYASKFGPFVILAVVGIILLMFSRR